MARLVLINGAPGSGKSTLAQVVLLSDPQDAVDRFVRRSLHPKTGVHRDAQVLLERCGGVGELAAMYDRLLDVVASRPGTISVLTVGGEVERAYRDLVAQVDHK